MRLPNGPSIPTLYLCSLWPVLSGLGKAPSAPCSCCALVLDGAVGLFAVWADSGPCTFFLVSSAPPGSRFRRGPQILERARSGIGPFPRCAHRGAPLLPYFVRNSRASRITFSFTSAKALACICSTVRLRLKLND